MTRTTKRVITIGVLAGLLVAGPGSAQEDAAPMDAAAEVRAGDLAEHGASSEAVAVLIDHVDKLLAEMEALRHELAAVRLEAAQAAREAEELRQFMRDHDEFGDDFARYAEVRKVAEREARRKEIERVRQAREEEKAQRRARYEQVRAQRADQNAAEDRLDRYHKAGFKDIGLNVFLGRTAYAYHTRSETTTTYDYDPWIGFHYRPERIEEIDYARMTISGSVLNATDEVRNLGIAVTFFDDVGNQVGAATIQVNNARPDVPYPFTSSLDMALNRPFTSSTSYVLYADPVE